MGKAKNGYDSGSEDDFDAKIDSGSDSDFKTSPPPKAQKAKPAATKKKLQNFGSVSDDEDGFGAKPAAKKAKKKRANQPNLRPLQKPKPHQRPKLQPKRPKPM